MNPSTFLILGLPRSRTAWLSCLFTTAKTFCFHELSGDVQTLEEYVHSLAIADGRCVGASDSGAPLILPGLMELMPETRIAYIRRNMHEAIDSFSMASGIAGEKCEPLFLNLQKRLNASEGLWPGMGFNFDRLDEEPEIRRMWDWLTRGLPFPEQHYAKMKNLRITQDHRLIREAARNGKKCVLTAAL